MFKNKTQFSHFMMPGIYVSVAKRLEEVLKSIDLEDKLPSIEMYGVASCVEYIKGAAKHLVFDLEESRKEYKVWLDLTKKLSTNSNQLLRKKELTGAQKKYLEDISQNWPDELKGLTEIYEILASVAGKCTYEKSIKDSDPIRTYMNLLNPSIKSPDDFIDFLIICAELRRHDSVATKKEKDELKERLEQQELPPFPPDE